MKKLLLHIFGYTFSAIIILLVAAVPIGGVYCLGESVWYLSTYESGSGLVVSCARKTFKSRSKTKYAPVVQFDGGERITSRSYGSKESCYSKKGKSIDVLINPENKSEAVINTFQDRWLMPLILLSIPGIFLFFYLKKRIG